MLPHDTSRVCGFSELVWDNVFEEHKAQELRYVGSAPGGSVFNVLANIAWRGGNTAAIAVGGDDHFGHTSREALRDLEVATDAIHLTVGKATRVVSERIRDEGVELIGGDRHVFSGKCFVCRRP